MSARVEESLAHFVRSFGETGATRTQFVDLLVELGVAMKREHAFTYVNDLVKLGRLDAPDRAHAALLDLPTRTTFPIPSKEN